MAYSYSALGGTFDHLHAGHHAFLRFSLAHSSRLILGLADGKLLQTKAYRHHIQSYEERQKELEKFFSEENRLKDVEIVRLLDPFGPTATDPSLEALFITPMTMQGVPGIQEARAQRGLSPLAVETAAMVLDKQGEHLSSTRIRAGEVARDGYVYSSLFSSGNFQCSSSLRRRLKEPFDEFVKTISALSQDDPIILIGDVTTQYFLEHHLSFSSAYVDGKTQRELVHLPPLMIETPVKNPAGTVTRQAAEHVVNHMKDKEAIYFVDGEEDLLVLPAVLCLPLGTQVVYGDPYGQQMVCIEVTEERKERLRDWIQSSGF